MRIAVIPARYDSSRFPGKVLADRTGKPLIQHVWERTCLAERVERVLVATDDRRIADAVEGFGGKAVMTRSNHPNGTSRIAEAVEGLAGDIIVNVQGDEPEIEPALIDLAVERLEGRPECMVSTLAAPFKPDEDPANPNIVKVVVDREGRALYFSRALVPHDRDGSGVAGPLKHVGLYVYRRSVLPTFVGMEPTPLERTERLEQLRFLESGYSIAVALCEAEHHGIDTPEQYEAFVTRCAAT